MQLTRISFDPGKSCGFETTVQFTLKESTGVHVSFTCGGVKTEVIISFKVGHTWPVRFRILTSEILAIILDIW
jgi:hypothetical protein